MIRVRSGPALARALVVITCAAVVAAFGPAAGGSPVTGSSGVDRGLGTTDSEVTLSGRGNFSDLKITVNQTKNLLAQAVSVTWRGGRPTVSAAGQFSANYLQMMECWGDDDGTNPQNPGPPPTQCVFGARNAVYGGALGNLFPPGSLASERVISKEKRFDGETDWPNRARADGAVDAKTGYVWESFHSVDGVDVGVAKDSSFHPDTEGGQYWLNPKFDVNSTNEVVAAKTGPDGVGSDLFEMKTGLEMKGLGCGQNVQPVAGGGTKQTKCWLVIVPRGTPADENVGTPYEENADQKGVMTSPLAPDLWANRIAVPLDFVPVESPCSLSQTQRLINGSELALPAVSRWQPRLCAESGSHPFAYGPLSDTSARQQLAHAAPGGPGMFVVSRPLDPALEDPDTPVVYAPLTVSGVVIGLNLERLPNVDADADAKKLAGTRVQTLNLTPRLLAKLLTQSYRLQVDILGFESPYEWAKTNPRHLGEDPDFLQYNPEFAELSITSGKNFGGLLLPVSNSDSARAAWEYVLADPEARAWLDGAPDKWGMKVNPAYATKAEANSTHTAFADPVPTNFPKDDTYCYQGPKTGVNGEITPPPLCGADWVPYRTSFRDAAQGTRAGDDGAKTVVNPFAFSPDKVYGRDVPQNVGNRVMMSLTDSASAYRYGLQVARLSRAGDDGSTRTFIAPDNPGLTAGLAGMKEKDVKGVLEPDPTVTAPGGYPLTALTYAAIKPLSLEQPVRDEYANFVSYATGDGQVPGFSPGTLPFGYAPLNADLKAQSVAAAKSIRELTLATAEDESADAGDTGSPLPKSPTDATDDSFGSFESNPVFSLEPPAATSVNAIQQLASPASVTRIRPGGMTPAVPVSFTRFTLPILLVLAALSVLGALEVSRQPRRRETVS